MAGALAVLVCLLAAAQQPNPCANGSFETLGSDGAPVDWQLMGTAAVVEDGAHAGQRYLRLSRVEDDPHVETGLNRAWEAFGGERGAMVDRLKGGIDFWYRAVSATKAQLNVYAIPMNAEPFERTGLSRATFTVPEAHIGDGQWHHGRLKYGFTSSDEAKWVHFSARILGDAGELHLDNFAYIERVGPLLEVSGLRLEDDAESPGDRCTLAARITNAGDLAAKAVSVQVALPPPLTATPAETTLKPLAPDAVETVTWQVDGARTAAGIFEVSAETGSVRASETLGVAPEMVVESFGPTSPVVGAGEKSVLQCVVRNTGHAIVIQPTAAFNFRGETVEAGVDRLPPQRSVVLEVGFSAGEESPGVPAGVRMEAGNVSQPFQATSTLIVGSSSAPPPPSGAVAAGVSEEAAVLENDRLRLIWRRNAFGFGPCELVVKTPQGWHTAAWLPWLGRVVHEERTGARNEQVFHCMEDPLPDQGSNQATLAFRCVHEEPGGATWRLTARFALTPGEPLAWAEYWLSCDHDRPLLAFDGPMLHAVEREEAVYPGLEWLVDDEVSSSTLDIEEGHPHQVRYVVHPNLITIPAMAVQSEHATVGLLWDVHQQWDGERDRPAAVFASPDRLNHQRAHLMGLMLPSVPVFVEPNTREAARPYPLKARQALRLRCGLVADGAAEDPLAVMDAWFDAYGFPEPAPLPRGSYEAEIAFSMQAYLDSLWVTDEQQWWSAKGGHPLMCRKARPRPHIADLLVGALLSPDEDVRERCRARATEVLDLIGGDARIDAQHFPGRADWAMANPHRAAALLAARGDDGAWRFDADRPGTGVFEGIDYHVLGPDDAVALGTCARNAFEVLRYARIAGDWEALERMQSTLALMETFRVPRAAQVWEVPFHTPDILAAADAVDAYLEAYWFSGDERWLEDAILWARRGLPFVYFWQDPERPYLLGGSIPVFGATFHRHSWFGQPVQWNGLRYANALLKLARHDQSYPWRQVAETVTRSALYQQADEGEDTALWPDSINAVDAKKSGWVFAPRLILHNVLQLMGREQEPQTVILGHGRERVHVTAIAKVSNAAWEGGAVSFRVEHAPGRQGVVLVSNVSRPSGVWVDGSPAAERAVVEQGAEAGWRYDGGTAFLSVRIPKDGPSDVRVEGVQFARVDRLPQPVEAMAFEFEESTEGWTPQHDVGALAVREGCLHGAITGADPYVVRSLVHVRGDDCPVVVVRMRVTAGAGGQFFWITEDAPAWSEDKQEAFALVADGAFHEYRLDVGRHPRWSGHRIAGIRVDPGGGVREGEFAIDYVRGAQH